MTETSETFEQLGLSEHILKALTQVGYETPSPIQAKSIPPLLEGRDILGQAQTGTGKTAAFALPILQQVDTSKQHPQVLVLAPTRELAIQVAEAFQTYAKFMTGFHILPIYGGQGYDSQIRALRRGVQVIVGTPGRVMDHMRKGTLKLDGLSHLVLDEADEMLRMGFVDDVEWILGHTPKTRQIALFSATMPKEIAKIANTYLNDPVQVKIKVKTSTAETIEQVYWPVSGTNKLDAITRILEAEPFDAMIIFVRTKTATVELSEKLEARGYSTAPLNGDISQNIRERTVDRLKKGKIDILVATDVAARGLDVERISHVLNYDIPYDTEAYVHRIGRTGRAGRSGKAILFVSRRETRMLRAIERATSKPIDVMKLPSTDDINAQRVTKFKEQITAAMDSPEHGFFAEMLNEYQKEVDADPITIAAALATMVNGKTPFLLSERAMPTERLHDNDRGSRGDRPERGRSERGERKPRRDDKDMLTYRIEVGYQDGVKPGNIVGAVANEAGIDSQYIGAININDDFSTVDLPKGMPDEVFSTLKNTWVCQKQLNISLIGASTGAGNRKPKFGNKPKGGPRGAGRGGPRKPAGGGHRGQRSKPNFD